MSEQSMHFRLSINCENDAFADHKMKDEIARCLRDVANRLNADVSCGKYRNILDINGNIVGQFVLTPFV